MTPTHLKRSSKPSRAIRTLVGTAALGLLAACSGDSIVAPTDMQRQNGLIGGVVGLASDLLSSVTGLLRTKTISAPIVRSVTVTRAAGGQLYIPETGLRLTVPPGAIRTEKLTITVTALAGRTVAYEFEPHGTTFAKPLVFTQDLDNTLFSLLSGRQTLAGGYFKDASQVNTMTGKATINEEIKARVAHGKVSFGLEHFSGYMVSTGRGR